MSQARCAIGAVFLNGQIVIFGGYNRGECLNSAEEYDVLKEVWRPLPNMCTERGRFDSAVVDGKVYAIAGSNGNNDLKICECYDPKLGQWTPIKSLSKARSHNGCATLDGLIYCLGGSSDQVVLKDCERYDPQKDDWRGLVVCCGGTDRWSCLDTVEAYEPRTDSWRVLAKLNTPRRGCAVSVIRDNLYVIGGHDGTQSLASVEVLEHPNANWRPGPSLTTPRANTHAVVTAANSIYVIGGFNNGNQFLSTIEVLENEPLGWRSWQRASVNLESSVIDEAPDNGQENENQNNVIKQTELKDSSSTETLTAKNTMPTFLNFISIYIIPIPLDNYLGQYMEMFSMLDAAFCAIIYTKIFRYMETHDVDPAMLRKCDELDEFLAKERIKKMKQNQITNYFCPAD
uniref:Uncharacterized protein n=1 Tax=Ditylenchus dipsaci TaxID=166011 RepID=A0A915CUC5_9BILA